MIRFLKILGWTLFAIALFVIGSAVAATRLLTPEKLTPLAEALANKHLNADISLGRAELDLRASSPFVTLQIDSITIISRDMRSLPPSARDTLPAWADTLASVGSIKAGLNLPRLATGVILLSDLEIHRPAANVLIVNDSLNNFSITVPDTEKQEESLPTSELPDLRIRGFKITDAGAMRFRSIPADMELTVRLTAASLQSLSDPDDAPPAYNINLYADFDTPALKAFNTESVNIGFDGDIDWKTSDPLRIGLTDFTVKADSVTAHFNTSVDCRDSIVVETFDGRLAPLPLAYVISRVPASAALPKGISTDAAVGFEARLTRPYTVGGTQTIPYADISVEIPQCKLKWQQLDIRQFMLSVQASLRGDDLNRATIDISRCVMAGPATEIELSGRLTNLIADPMFDGRIDGHTALHRLPAILTDKALNGGSVSGRIDLRTDIKARPSMLTRNEFHRLKIDGSVHLSDFTYVSADTLTSVGIRNLWARLGTNSSVSGKASDGTDRRIDSLLTASIETDTLTARAPGISSTLSGFKIGIGAENKALSADTTSIIPLGGMVQCRLASVTMPADSVRIRVIDVSGSIGLRRYHDDAHRPQLNLNTSIGRIAALTPDAKFMANDNRLSARVHLADDSPSVRERKMIRALADSIAALHPSLPSDSIVALAMARREQIRAARRHRLPASSDSQAQAEVIDWGMGKDARRLLLDWVFSGELKSAKARLYTPAFPLRNSMEHLDLRFNNDSIILSEMAYKAGRSDFSVSGTVSNIKRALTSRRAQPLRMALDLNSDTLDVNQIAAAFFNGAAARERIFDADIDSDSMEMSAAEPSDTAGPLLVPVNVDATFRMRARNIIYSDFMLHDLKGIALMRDGALNLRSLKASSQIGGIDFSALYAAPKADDMKFAFGLDLERFRVGDFLNLMPAIDSIMPMIGDFDGVVNATIAATADITPRMDLDLASLDAAVKIEGDSLVVLDPETFKTMSKWLMFKNKNQNLIRHMAVELTVHDNELTLYPFMFEIDRYRLGVQGHNDLAMNFDYHVAVLKSPLPFKFGINIKGNADDYKIRVGKARFNEKQAAEQRSIADTTRINLINQVENIFRRGIRGNGRPKINISDRPAISASPDAAADTISAADSLMLRQQGIDL